MVNEARLTPIITKFLAYDRQKENSSNTHPPPIIMACGGKDVGKSTLLRFTINSLLNRFILISLRMNLDGFKESNI